MTDRPTDAELAILRVLWELGPSTVRDVHTALELRQERELAYTTVLKLLQVMHDKGLVLRDESARSHVYTPTSSEGAVQDRLLGDLVDKAFGGSAGALVLRALSERPAGADELAEIRALLDQLERDRRLG
ncbi:MAG: BlaI/MecI/CopY family transcriptional regulator [Myxococcota bacterium]